MLLWPFSDDLRLKLLSISNHCESGEDQKMLFKQNHICYIENLLATSSLLRPIVMHPPADK